MFSMQARNYTAERVRLHSESRLRSFGGGLAGTSMSVNVATAVSLYRPFETTV